MYFTFIFITDLSINYLTDVKHNICTYKCTSKVERAETDLLKLLKPKAKEQSIQFLMI